VQQQAGQISPDGYWMWNGAEWVPNPYRPVPAPPVSVPYGSAASRATVTSILLAVNIAGTVLFTIATVIDDLNPSPGDEQTAAVIAVLTLLAVVVWFATFIACIVFFSMWLHRVVRNMPQLGAPDPRWSPARSVVYCFIPILNLVHPLWSVLDAWRGAAASRRWLDKPSRRAIRPPLLFAGWWTTWLVGNYSFNISARLSGTAAAIFDVVGGMGICVAAALCILIVRDVTARQERKSQLIASGQLV
jgi:uncharacterized protein DUF4328